MEVVAGLAGLLIGTATARVLVRCRAAAEARRLQAHVAARIRYWQDEAERAKATAARAEERSAAWADGYQQGREDALALAQAILETNVGNSLTASMNRS